MVRIAPRLIAAALLAGASLPVLAGGQPFDAAAFRAAEDAGKAILVEVYARWCGTCREQSDVLEKLSRDPAYAGLVQFQINFDSQKDAARALKAGKQSTLVLFKGRREVARSIWETDEEEIRAMLKKAL